jgi:ankyrin repeat protein
MVWPREPRYHGRSLSAWLAALDDGEGGNGIVWDAKSPPAPTKQQLEAAEAVRQMGTDALPELLRMLQAEDSPLVSIKQRLQMWLVQSGRARPTFQPDWHTAAARTRHLAALGIVALGPNAKPPASLIVPLFRKPEFSKEAGLVLASLGQPGLRPLQSAITNNLAPWEGAVAVWALAHFPTNGQAIMPDLLQGLNSKRPGFRTTCAWALTRIQTDPEVAVQALTNHADEEGMRYLCLKALGNYGARATSAVPFLIDMLQSLTPSRRHDVLETLRAIDPEAEGSLQHASMWMQVAFGGEIDDAARNGDLEKVKTLLKDHPDLVSSKDSIGQTPLHWAAVGGHKDVVELLLANKADVNAKANNGVTPLHWAAVRGHKDVAELLLASKANVDAKANNGVTPLHWAAVGGHKDVAELLLVHGAEVNAKYSDGYTPLHYAAANGHKDVAELLLANQAEVNATDEQSQTPLHLAAQNDHKGVAELLLACKAEVNATDEHSQTPLHLAALYGYKDEVMEVLLANQADVNAKDYHGNTPLHLAAARGYKDMAELLLASKAEVNAKDNYGQTPLHVAADKGHKDVAGVLRQHGGHE